MSWDCASRLPAALTCMIFRLQKFLRAERRLKGEVKERKNDSCVFDTSAHYDGVMSRSSTDHWNYGWSLGSGACFEGYCRIALRDKTLPQVVFFFFINADLSFSFFPFALCSIDRLIGIRLRYRVREVSLR